MSRTRFNVSGLGRKNLVTSLAESKFYAADRTVFAVIFIIAFDVAALNVRFVMLDGEQLCQAARRRFLSTRKRNDKPKT